MISVKNLQKQFPTGQQVVQPLRNVNFTIEEGTFAAIVGKSGSGKSTLLSILGALANPTSGTITVDGKEVSSLTGKQASEYRREDIGFVFQGYNLIPNMSAIENVMLPMEYLGFSVAEQKARAAKLLDSVGLTGDSHTRRSNMLSGGEQQRVAIARALANKPKLILADEPTGNLDEETGATIVELLRSLCKEYNTTIIVVTHDVDLAKQADQLFVLQAGVLLEKQ